MGKVSKALDKSDNWMAGAVKNPGSLRATAAAEGAITPAGTISKPWEAKKAKGKGKTAARARLAETFGKARRK